MSFAVPLMYFDGRPFTRAEARDAGWTDNRLSKLVDTGLIRRLLHGVYVDALAPDTIELRAAALCLVAPADAVVCRRTAAWLYGIDAFALRELDESPAVECVRPIRRRATRLRPATAVHLARHLRRPFALSAVDAMLHAELIGPAALRAAVARYPRHPGIVQAREIAGLAEPLTESPGESWLRLRVLDAGFPRPEAQVVVRGGDRVYRLDLGFREPGPDGLRLGLEYDSDRWHSGRAADLRDETRRAGLRALGWTILPVRRGDVWGRKPDLELAIGELLGIQPRLPRGW